MWVRCCEDEDEDESQGKEKLPRYLRLKYSTR